MSICIHWKHHTMYKSVMITRSRQRVKKMATYCQCQHAWNGTMRMKWACPKYGGGRVVWCGPCLRRWVCHHVQEGEWLALQQGGEEVVTHQLTAQTAHVHSTGGDKQSTECTHAHAQAHTHAHTETVNNTLSSQCPHVHTHTHTSISTHDKVMQITFTHSRCTNVISSLTSIIGLLSGHSGQ